MTRIPLFSSSDSAFMQKDKFIAARLTALAIILFVELMVVSLNFDAYLPRIFDRNVWFSFLGYAGQFAKFVVVIIAAITLALWARLPGHFNALKTSLNGYRFYYFLCLQIIVFLLFYWCTDRFFIGVQIHIERIIVWLTQSIRQKLPNMWHPS